MANDDIIIRIRAELKQARNNLRKIRNEVSAMERPNVRSFERVAKAQMEVENRMKALGKATGKLQTPFQGWALSVMFFGMALQRVFTSIWKSTTQTFQDVMHSVDGTVTGFDMLNSSVSFLQFAIGSALEPIAYWLFPIVDKIATWVTENEDLVRTLLVAAGTIGTILMTVGLLTLSISGLIDMFAKIKFAVDAAAVALGAFGTPVLLAIALIIAALVLLYAAWETNLGDIQEFVKSTFGVIWETIKSIMGNIFKIFSGIFKIIKGIMTGDFQMIWEGIVQILVNALAIILKLIYGAAAILYNVAAFVINLIKDLIISLLSLILSSIRSTINALNLIPGVNIDTGFIDQAQDMLDQARETFTLGYLTGDDIAQDMGGIDALSQMAQDWLTGLGGGTTTNNTTNNITINNPDSGQWDQLLSMIQGGS